MVEAGTTERVLQLLGLLQQRRAWTGPELAARLGVTPRTVRRDVERLRALGYPVQATQGVGGGYQLGAGRALPPLLLDDEEAIATAVSLRRAAGGTVAGASEAALRTLAKLDQVLPARLRAEVRALHDSIATLQGGPIEVDADALMLLATAIRDRVRVEFDYVRHAEAAVQATRRRVEPYRLVATGRRWYLMAYDLDREDWRTFRLDRISVARASTWQFALREHPDPVRFVHEAITIGGYVEQAEVVLHLDATTARDRVSVGTSTIEPLDQSRCLLRFGGNDLRWMALHLAGLGCDFEVRHPVALRELCEAMAGRLTRAGGEQPTA
jgi:predicted DNA-binding transcriptional regulator YafY